MPINYKLTKHNRLLPYDIRIFPNIIYRDANDVSENERQYVRDFFANDSEYRRMASLIRFGSEAPIYGKQYCMYVYKDGELLGNLIYKEILNHELGYSKDDFLVSKRIFSKFRRTKYSRYAAGDMLHILFKSGTAKKLYTNITRRPGSDGNTFWELADFTAPCAGLRLPSDGPNVQKYINVKKVYDTSIVIEFDGEIYNSMDLRSYFLAPGNRTEEMVDRWLNEMDQAAAIVREAQYGR